jgi:hypothetical protein
MLKAKILTGLVVVSFLASCGSNGSKSTGNHSAPGESKKRHINKGEIANLMENKHPIEIKNNRDDQAGASAGNDASSLNTSCQSKSLSVTLKANDPTPIIMYPLIPIEKGFSFGYLSSKYLSANTEVVSAGKVNPSSEAGSAVSAGDSAVHKKSAAVSLRRLAAVAENDSDLVSIKPIPQVEIRPVEMSSNNVSPKFHDNATSCPNAFPNAVPYKFTYQSNDTTNNDAAEKFICTNGENSINPKRNPGWVWSAYPLFTSHSDNDSNITIIVSGGAITRSGSLILSLNNNALEFKLAGNYSFLVSDKSTDSWHGIATSLPYKNNYGELVFPHMSFDKTFQPYIQAIHYYSQESRSHFPHVHLSAKNLKEHSSQKRVNSDTVIQYSSTADDISKTLVVDSGSSYMPRLMAALFKSQSKGFDFTARSVRDSDGILKSLKIVQKVDELHQGDVKQLNSALVADSDHEHAELPPGDKSGSLATIHDYSAEVGIDFSVPKQASLTQSWRGKMSLDGLFPALKLGSYRFSSNFTLQASNTNIARPIQLYATALLNWYNKAYLDQRFLSKDGECLYSVNNEEIFGLKRSMDAISNAFHDTTTGIPQGDLTGEYSYVMANMSNDPATSLSIKLNIGGHHIGKDRTQEIAAIRKEIDEMFKRPDAKPSVYDDVKKLEAKIDHLKKLSPAFLNVNGKLIVGRKLLSQLLMQSLEYQAALTSDPSLSDMLKTDKVKNAWSDWINLLAKLGVVDAKKDTLQIQVKFIGGSTVQHFNVPPVTINSISLVNLGSLLKAALVPFLDERPDITKLLSGMNHGSDSGDAISVEECSPNTAYQSNTCCEKLGGVYTAPFGEAPGVCDFNVAGSVEECSRNTAYQSKACCEKLGGVYTAASGKAPAVCDLWEHN